MWAQIFPTFPNYLLYLVRIHLASEISEQDFIMGPISWAFGHSTLVACHESVRLISEASLKNDHDLIWGLWKTQTVKLGMLKIVKFSTSGDSVNLMSEVFSAILQFSWQLRPSKNSYDPFCFLLPRLCTTKIVLSTQEVSIRGYPLVICHSYWKWPFILRFCDFPSFFVCLPEGISH